MDNNFRYISLQFENLSVKISVLLGPDLKKARRFHSCGTFEYQSEIYIIVVGGYVVGGDTKTTELLNTKDTYWFYGTMNTCVCH